MANSIARFVPTTYNMSELKILTNTFEEFFFKHEREYKRVEYVKTDINEVEFFEQRPYKNFKNNEEIHEMEYEDVLGEDTVTLERNHLTFLQDYKVCDFFFYHMHDGSILPVIEIDFFSEAEREQFVRPYWFGNEVREDKFSNKALWEQVNDIEEVEQ